MASWRWTPPPRPSAAVKSLGDITVLAAGGSAAAAGEAAAKIDGVSKVLVAEDASLGHRLAESTAALIVRWPTGMSTSLPLRPPTPRT